MDGVASSRAKQGPMDLTKIFCDVGPVRCLLLSMLRPFDIANLLSAIQCEVSCWERQRHMDVIDDILQDSRDISVMKDLGMTVRIFGSDIAILERRLRHPLEFQNSSTNRPFYVFVVVTSPNTTALFHDFRRTGQQHLAPEDKTIEELDQDLGINVSREIATLSRWILCAPYLSGSLSSAVPGWIPVSNACKDINVRAFISSFDRLDSRLLYMNRDLTSAMFGLHSINILSRLDRLKARCITIRRERRKRRNLRGSLTLSYLNDLADMESTNAEKEGFMIVNAIWPLSSAVTLQLR